MTSLRKNKVRERSRFGKVKGERWSFSLLCFRFIFEAWSWNIQYHTRQAHILTHSFNLSRHYSAHNAFNRSHFTFYIESFSLSFLWALRFWILYLFRRFSRLSLFIYIYSIDGFFPYTSHSSFSARHSCELASFPIFAFPSIPVSLILSSKLRSLHLLSFSHLGSFVASTFLICFNVVVVLCLDLCKLVLNSAQNVEIWGIGSCIGCRRQDWERTSFVCCWEVYRNIHIICFSDFIIWISDLLFVMMF